MCGDFYPIEMIFRMILFNRKYYYYHESNMFQIIYECRNTNKIYALNINFLPYHCNIETNFIIKL